MFLPKKNKAKNVQQWRNGGRNSLIRKWISRKWWKIDFEFKIGRCTLYVRWKWWHECLTRKIDDENVCERLHIGIFSNLSTMIRICKEYIVLNSAKVFQSAGLLKCERETLAHILKLSILECSEVDIFHMRACAG